MNPPPVQAPSLSPYKAIFPPAERKPLRHDFSVHTMTKTRLVIVYVGAQLSETNLVQRQALVQDFMLITSTARFHVNYFDYQNT
jgi:hypothetical protein